MAINLKITSWNCGGFSFNFREENEELIKELSSDIFCIQETHLVSCKDHKKCPNNGEGSSFKIPGSKVERAQFYECYLKSTEISETYNYTALSHPDANKQGGQRWGLAILWKKDLNGFTCGPVPVPVAKQNGKTYHEIHDTYEFNAVQVEAGDLKVLVINVYIRRKEPDKARVILDLISELCVDWKNIVICGDFNFKPWITDKMNLRKELNEFKKFRADLYARGLNVVDVDKLQFDTFTYETKGEKAGFSWPDHFITSPFVTENCELNVVHRKSNETAHYPITMNFNPSLNGKCTKGIWSIEDCKWSNEEHEWCIEEYEWDVLFYELLAVENKPPTDFSQHLVEEKTCYKFKPFVFNHGAKKSAHSRTFFKKHTDFFCPGANCVMDMQVLPHQNKLVLELKFFDMSSSLFDLFQISCRFKIECKLSKGRISNVCLSSSAEEVEKNTTTWEIPLIHFFDNVTEDFFNLGDQFEIHVEMITKYNPQLEPNGDEKLRKLWKVDTVPESESEPESEEVQETICVQSKYDSKMSFTISLAHFTAQMKKGGSQPSPILVPIRDEETLSAFKQYLKTGGLSTKLDHSSTVQLAETANEYGLDELKKFCLRHITFTSTDDTVSESIAMATRLKAEKECLEIMYNYVLRRFAALKLEAGSRINT